MTQHTLVLLPGTKVVLGETQNFILPEDHSDLTPEDFVLLVNEQQEEVGTGYVVFLDNKCFAHLQQFHFDRTAHPELTSWGVASEAMKLLVDGFSITDPVSVIGIKVVSVSEPGFTIKAASPTTDTEEEIIPQPEVMYEGLDELAEEVAG